MERNPVLESGCGVGQPRQLVINITTGDVSAIEERVPPLCVVAGEEIAGVAFWSRELEGWVRVAAEPMDSDPFLHVVTPEQVQRMTQFLQAGWDMDTVLYRVLGVKR